jgi:hypothetical protein
MTNHTLYRCSDCRTVTVMTSCPKNAAHSLRALPEAEANNYVRIGHDAFRELPEPQAVPCPVRPDAVEAFKRRHGA